MTGAELYALFVESSLEFREPWDDLLTGDQEDWDCFAKVLGMRGRL